MTALPGERDLNFRLDTAGAAYVLKFANAEERRAHLELQHAALAHLARREPGLALQRVVPARDGSDLMAIASADGVEHWVRLLTFLPGRLWSEACARRRPSPALLASLGATLGAVDRGLADFDSAAAHRDRLRRPDREAPGRRRLDPRRRDRRRADRARDLGTGAAGGS